MNRHILIDDTRKVVNIILPAETKMMRSHRVYLPPQLDEREQKLTKLGYSERDVKKDSEGEDYILEVDVIRTITGMRDYLTAMKQIQLDLTEWIEKGYDILHGQILECEIKRMENELEGVII